MGLTIHDLETFARTRIAECFLRGDRQQLLVIQHALGFVAVAAEAVHDQTTAQQYRILAAQAANASERLDPKE